MCGGQFDEFSCSIQFSALSPIFFVEGAFLLDINMTAAAT
jgi:hypothetical protein